MDSRRTGFEAFVAGKMFSVLNSDSEFGFLFPAQITLKLFEIASLLSIAIIGLLGWFLLANK